MAPPELPVYEQPLCPQPNYMWTPGYWAWGCSRWLLLGSGKMDDGASDRPALDPGLLGLE